MISAAPPTLPPATVSDSPRPLSGKTAPSTNPAAKLFSSDHFGASQWDDLSPLKLVGYTATATVLENAIWYPLWTLKTWEQV